MTEITEGDLDAITRRAIARALDIAVRDECGSDDDAIAAEAAYQALDILEREYKGVPVTQLSSLNREQRPLHNAEEVEEQQHILRGKVIELEERIDRLYRRRATAELQPDEVAATS